MTQVAPSGDRTERRHARRGLVDQDRAGQSSICLAHAPSDEPNVRFLADPEAMDDEPDHLIARRRQPIQELMQRGIHQWLEFLDAAARIRE